MKNFNAAMKRMFPQAAPLVDALERDMAEIDAQYDRDLERFRKQREEQREVWDKRTDDLLR